MLLALIAAATMPSLAMPLPSPLAGLAGCWQVRGTVEGKPTTAIARAGRRLGGRYLLLELHGLNPKDPYDAAIIMAEAGPGQLTGWWMDSFGGPGSAAGKGGVIGMGFSISYDYGGAVFINRFTPQGRGWRWQIDSQARGKPAKLFASYTLNPMRCRPGFSVF